MPDDTDTTRWKRLTDKVKETARAVLGRSTNSAVEREELIAATPHADSGATCSRPSAYARTTAAGSRADRDGEAIPNAALLATWEDEGGMTSSRAEVPLRKS
jgi:hypothetical protein